jgi:uncharacterized protein (TIGR00369 family)
MPRVIPRVATARCRRYRIVMASGFDPVAAANIVARIGHNGALGIRVLDVGADWSELALDYRDDLIGQPATGVIASGPIITLMDMATSIAVWAKRGVFKPQATLDLRIDYLRSATPGRTVIGRGECLRLTRRVAFVRGQAHDGDPADPIAHVAGTFMMTDES